MDVLLIYDVNNHVEDLKTELKKKGYNDFWYLNETILNFPDNILSKKAANTDEPLIDIKVAIESLNKENSWKIVLERCISVEYGAWSAVPGKPVVK